MAYSLIPVANEKAELLKRTEALPAVPVESSVPLTAALSVTLYSWLYKAAPPSGFAITS